MGSSATARTRTLTREKDGHRFVLTYDVGFESDVVDQLVAMINDKRVPFTWDDAAFMSYQLGKNLVAEVRAIERGARNV